MDKSNEILSQILKEELERLARIETVYKEELDNLPKGKVMFKNIKGRDYPYLQYRSGSKIKSIYISNETKIHEIEKGLARRKELEQAIKRVSFDKKQLEKTVRVMHPKRNVRKES